MMRMWIENQTLSAIGNEVIDENSEEVINTVLYT